MSKILIIGGTGFAGSFIAKEAVSRGHMVTVLSRSTPKDPIDGVAYMQGPALDVEFRTKLIDQTDVVVAAVSPIGDMAGKVKQLYLDIAGEAAKAGARFIIVGGFSSLRPAVGQPRFFESGNVPPEYLAVAIEMANVFDVIKKRTPTDLRWVYISPAAEFGAYANVANHGTYRTGTDIALFDDNNESKISGADFALGVVDEIDNNTHNDENISFVQ